MATAIAVTGFGVDMKTARADIEATVSIVDNGDNTVKNQLIADRASINGTVLANYLHYDGVEVESTSTKQSCEDLRDKKLGTRWETESADNQDLDINLHNVYKIKAIGMFWEDASAKSYVVQGSVDGVNYTDIKTVASDYHQRTDVIVFAEEQEIRYLRLHCMTRTTPYGFSIYEMAVWGLDDPKEIIPDPKVFGNLKVRSYAQYTGKYMIYFDEGENATKYNVYIDGAKSPIKSIKKPGEYLTNKDLAIFDDGRHTMSVTCVTTENETTVESEALTTEFTKEPTRGDHSDMPQVYIEGKNISQEYHTKNDFAVSVVDSDGGTDGLGYTGDDGTVKDSDVIKRFKDFADGLCNMKVRGNTTAGQPKKGYNIKLSSKSSLLGMDKAKKWCLLANAMDKSLVRDFLSYNFALENGVKYASQSRYVELYVSGKYLGSYQLCEAVEAKKGRVDIDAYNAESNDILLEIGTRNEEGVDHFTTDVLRTTFDVNDPEKGDDLTDQEVDAKIARVKNFLNDFETMLRNHKYADLEAYMDVDSFVDFYVVNELFKNQDFNFSSTRFRVEGGKVYAGPIWDLDLSSGNLKSSYYTDYYVNGDSTKGYKCKSMNWYKELFKIPEFEQKVKEKYEALQYRIQSLYRQDSVETLSINYVTNRYGKSFNRNYASQDNLGAGWPIKYDDGYSYAAESNWNSWTDTIDFLRDWLERRNTWLCTEYGIDMEAAYVASMPKEEETTTAEPTTEAKTTVAPTTEVTTTVALTTEVTTTVAPTSEAVTDSTSAELTSEAATDSTSAELTSEALTDVTKEAESEVQSTEAGSEVQPTEAESEIQSTTAEVITTTANQPATSNDTAATKPAKVKINKITKKKSAKSMTISIRKVAGVKGYQVAVFSTAKAAKKLKKALFKKFVKKNSAKLVVKHKKLKNKKKLYVRVRAYIKPGQVIYGAWSATKKIK